MEIYKDDSYGQNIIENLNYFLIDKKFCDVKLKVDDKEYPCHKILLIASSLYFEKMFSDGFQEKSLPVIELFGISQNGFDQIYSYIYSGEISITKENVKDVYDVSDMYLYDKIKQRLVTFMFGDINSYTCVDYWLFSEQRNITMLMDRCNYIMINSFERVCFLNNNLVAVPFDTFLQLIKQDELDCKNEGQVLEIVCNWIQNNDISTEQKKSLLNEIKWGILEVDDFENLAKYSDVLADQYTLWKSLITMYTKESCNKKILIEKQHSSHFIYRSFKLKAIVGGYDIHSGRILSSIRWPFEHKPLIHLPTRLCFTAAVTIGNHIVIIGGKSNHNQDTMYIESFVRAYNIKSKSWHLLQQMRTSRWQHVAVAFNDYILVVGGRDENGQVLDSVDKYDIFLNKWIKMKPFVKKIAKLKGCCLNDEVYICGGYFNAKINNYVDNDFRGWKNKYIYKYNAKDDEWIRVCAFPKDAKKFNAISMCTFNNKIYIAGHNTLKFMVFDPITSNIYREDYHPDIPLLDTNEILLPYGDSFY